jgi:hypothetical protein
VTGLAKEQHGIVAQESTQADLHHPPRRVEQRIPSRDAHACGSRDEVTIRESGLSRRSSGEHEESDSSDEDSGYAIAGFSSIRDTSDFEPHIPPGLVIYVQTYPGYTQREIFRKTPSHLSDNKSCDQLDGLPFVSRPLVIQELYTYDLLQHLREYKFNELGDTLLSPLRIRERALTENLLFSLPKREEDFDIVEMYNNGFCNQFSGRHTESFWDIIKSGSNMERQDFWVESMITARLTSNYRQPLHGTLGGQFT